MKSCPVLILLIFAVYSFNFASAATGVPSSPEVVNLKYINNIQCIIVYYHCMIKLLKTNKTINIQSI